MDPIVDEHFRDSEAYAILKKEWNGERNLLMKRGMIALNPRAAESDSLMNFCEQIKILQQRGLWDELYLLSVIHQSFFTYSPEEYNQRRETLITEVRSSLNSGVRSKIQFKNIDVLDCPSSGDEEVVRMMSDWVFKKRAQVLVLGVDTTHLSSRWSLEGIPVTATFVSPVPVLIVDVREPFSFIDEETPEVLLAVDASEPPSAKALRRFTRLAKPLNAKVHLVHVMRKRKLPILAGSRVAAFDQAREVLHDTAVILNKFGLESEMEVLKENESVAHTISEYVRKHGIWVAAVTSPVRNIKHRVLWGSTTQAMLGHLGCPLLVLRTR